MKIFLKKKNKFLFLEVPLLIESKLSKYFDKIIFVDAKKKIRLKRYIKRGGKKKTFGLLDGRQLSPIVKKKLSDYSINNNSSLTDLKKAARDFIKDYE
jgi:dephospho-CoA kinase